MKMRTLYKLTSAGKTQIWYREIDGDKYRSVSGQIDGKKTVSEWTTAKSKNVGRSNETSGEEQAVLECEAEYRKKLAQGGYKESIDDIDTPNFFKPMLAEKIDDYPVTEEEWARDNVWSSRKLDGMRAVVTKDGMFTRQGKDIPTCPHILDALKPFFEDNPDAILDGELYNHEYYDNFNKIMSLCRKQKPTAAHLAETAEKVQYHIFDYPSVEGWFGQRYVCLVLDYSTYMTADCLVLVESESVTDPETLAAMCAGYMADGYEGQMVRVDDTGYEKKRTKKLRKVKSFIDAEFVVLSIEEGKGNREGMAGFIIYELEDGRTTKSGIKGGVEFYKEIFENKEKYIGGVGTIRFQDYTPDGRPRLPVTVALYPEGRNS
jgi:ATP-dependent DNA ligase